jgi:hypothetical protein
MVENIPVIFCPTQNSWKIKQTHNSLANVDTRRQTDKEVNRQTDKQINIQADQ